MTEKRFTITQDFEEHYKQIRDNGHIIMGCFVEPQAEVIVNLLNEQHEQIERLKQNFKALDEVKCELAEDNEQLKQRNNRQYEQLGRLYNLIEQKEWRVLTDIIDDLKKSDEQLQKEGETYGDVE